MRLLLDSQVGASWRPRDCGTAQFAPTAPRPCLYATIDTKICHCTFTAPASRKRRIARARAWWTAPCCGLRTLAVCDLYPSSMGGGGQGSAPSVEGGLQAHTERVRSAGGLGPSYIHRRALFIATEQSHCATVIARAAAAAADGACASPAAGPPALHAGTTVPTCPLLHPPTPCCRQVRRELGMLAWPGRDWVRPRTAEGGRHMYDVLIVGAGAARGGGLRREGEACVCACCASHRADRSRCACRPCPALALHECVPCPPAHATPARCRPVRAGSGVWAHAGAGLQRAVPGRKRGRFGCMDWVGGRPRRLLLWVPLACQQQGPPPACSAPHPARPARCAAAQGGAVGDVRPHDHAAHPQAPHRPGVWCAGGARCRGPPAVCCAHGTACRPAPCSRLRRGQPAAPVPALLPAGMPSLTFQAYYEARFGAAAWQALDKIPKQLWCAGCL